MSKPNIAELARHVTQYAAGIGAGITTVGLSLTLGEVSTIVGIVTALATVVLNGIFTYRRDRREQRESEAKLARLREPS